MSEKLAIAVEKLYDERKEFIIIGLTGRTGSGCSTIAKMLSSTKEELGLPRSDISPNMGNKERKDSIIFSFHQENWEKFKVIEMRNMITTFIIANTYEEFLDYILTLNIGEEMIVKKVAEEEIKNIFSDIREKRRNVVNKVNEYQYDDDIVYNFYFEELGEFTQKFKDALEHIGKEAYTKIYQTIANNIRSSGEAYIQEFNQNNIFRLAQRTNLLIKILRARNKVKKDKGEEGRVVVVIDAFRNPYEAIFFKDRYSSFYLFAINTDEDERINRLHNGDLTTAQIENIDEREYHTNEKLREEELFSHQNIQKCIELADVYLYNKNNVEAGFKELKRNLVKYVSLIMHPGLIPPSHLERCMQTAYNAKLSSGCISRQVGAVITDENFSIKAVGWNSVAEDQIPCILRDIRDLVKHEDDNAFSEFERNNRLSFKNSNKKITCFKEECERKMKVANVHRLKGRRYSFCFKDIYTEAIGQKNQVHTRSLHAEENAFLQIVKYGGEGIKGGKLFTTASPCELCAKKAYQLGIKEIYYIDPYPGISEKHILGYEKDKNPRMILFDGAIGRAFTQLYTPIIPFKDELELLLL